MRGSFWRTSLRASRHTGDWRTEQPFRLGWKNKSLEDSDSNQRRIWGKRFLAHKEQNSGYASYRNDRLARKPESASWDESAEKATCDWNGKVAEVAQKDECDRVRQCWVETTLLNCKNRKHWRCRCDIQNLYRLEDWWKDPARTDTGISFSAEGLKNDLEDMDWQTRRYAQWQ